MRYLIVVVTHGASPHLAVALDSVREHLVPHPARGLLWVDGPDVGDAALDVIAGHGIHDWTFSGSAEQRWFCTTYADAWEEAVEEAETHECDHVFWLESDFVANRLVDVSALAYLLKQRPDLAQVALMRNAVNDHEVAAGGLYESRPGEYDQEAVNVTQEPVVHGARIRRYPWLRHSSYFTTNPNLMTVDFMRSHPWPNYASTPSDCEGKFGIQLIEKGYSFGVWGNGEPWCEHLGKRTGFGY